MEHEEIRPDQFILDPEFEKIMQVATRGGRLPILAAYAVAGETVSVESIADSASTPLSTTYKFITELSQAGLIERGPNGTGLSSFGRVFVIGILRFNQEISGVLSKSQAEKVKKEYPYWDADAIEKLVESTAEALRIRRQCLLESLEG